MSAVAANVLLVGSPYWCRHLKELLNKHSAVNCHTVGGTFRWTFSPARTICLVGVGPPDTVKRFVYHATALVLLRLRIARYLTLYWIGSDVMRLRPGDAFVSGCRNVAGSKWIADEVRGKGYDCVDRLFPVELHCRAGMPFPAAGRLQVLSYIPDVQHELHGSTDLMHLAERWPDIDFKVIGGVGAWWRGHPDNVRFVGWVDDVSVPISESHVLLRRTNHDSFSALVREGIVSGRHVIFTYDVPGVTWIRSGDTGSLMAKLGELRDLCRLGELKSRLAPDDILRLISDVRSQARALADELG